MVRRIYIISADTEITPEIEAEAALNDCGEIIKGIPPVLVGIVTESMLPYVYEEPEYSSPPADFRFCDYWAIITDIDINNIKPVEVKITSNGQDYLIRCYITDDLERKKGLTHRLQIGDPVLVVFPEFNEDKPVVYAAIYKSW